MGIRVIWGLLSAAAFDGGDQSILLGIWGLDVVVVGRYLFLGGIPILVDRHSVFFVGLLLAVVAQCATIICRCCWFVYRSLMYARRDRPSNWHSVFFVGLLLGGPARCANGNLYLLLGCVLFVTVRSPRQTIKLAFGIFCWFVVGGRCSVRKR
jgi:hypothetical protein